MKFAKLFVLLFLAAMVFSANVGFADVTTDVNNENTNTVSATGGDADQNQDQTQNQGQTVMTPRNHIVAPLPNAFVGAPVADSEGWKPFVCQPHYQNFSKERVKNMLESGSFWDRKGGLIDAFFRTPIKSSISEKFAGTVDDKSITRLDWIPQGPNDKFLGKFTCEGEYGWPLDLSLARCLDEAKRKTNASRVVVFTSKKKNAKNSGFSVGTGGAASRMVGGGSNGDDIAASIALGGLIGSTHAYIEDSVDVEVLAFNDGAVDPPAGLNVCGQQTLSVAPQAAQPQAKACDPETIQKLHKALEGNRIAIYGDVKKEGCNTYCLNNLRLRLERANLFYVLYKCTGRREALFEARKDYKIAAENYKFGSDIKKNKTEADRLLAEVYQNWTTVQKEEEK